MSWGGSLSAGTYKVTLTEEGFSGSLFYSLHPIVQINVWGETIAHLHKPMLLCLRDPSGFRTNITCSGKPPDPRPPLHNQGQCVCCTVPHQSAHFYLAHFIPTAHLFILHLIVMSVLFTVLSPAMSTMPSRRQAFICQMTARMNEWMSNWCQRNQRIKGQGRPTISHPAVGGPGLSVSFGK